MHDFLAATIGGVMIGAAALVVLASHGKVMGISGILSQLLPPSTADWAWRSVFLAGVLVGPLVYRAVHGDMPEFSLRAEAPLLAVAGFIVGVGTVTGNGCTSGHGVCGLSRFSIRSAIATITFMLTAAATVFVSRHLL